MESGMWVGGVSKGRSCKGLLLCRALGSAGWETGKAGDWNGQGRSRLSAYAGPCSHAHLIPDGFLLVSPCVTVSLFFLGSPKIETLR